MRGIHRWPVNSPHKGPVTRKIFPFDDVIVGKVNHFISYRGRNDSLNSCSGDTCMRQRSGLPTVRVQTCSWACVNQTYIWKKKPSVKSEPQYIFSLTELYLKMSSAKWLSLGSGLNVLLNWTKYNYSICSLQLSDLRNKMMYALSFRQGVFSVQRLHPSDASPV